jgi:hypothetical protein
MGGSEAFGIRTPFAYDREPWLPGAGLPKLELFIGRLLFFFKRHTGTRASFNVRFLRERTRIGQLVQACEPGLLSRPVLITRARGMEDSSRHWSVLMTLDHLRIVHREMARIIGDLIRGDLPQDIWGSIECRSSGLSPGFDWRACEPSHRLRLLEDDPWSSARMETDQVASGDGPGMPGVGEGPVP